MNTTTTTKTKTLYVAKLANGTFFNVNLVWKYARMMWELKPHKRITKGTLYGDADFLKAEVAKFKLEGVEILTVKRKVKVLAEIVA